MKRINLEKPVDFLLETDNHIVACAYQFKENERSGALYFLNKETLELVSKGETSGTLQAFYKDGILYTANASNVSAFKETKELHRYNTEALNTCIFVEDFVYIGNVNGNIIIFNRELEKLSVLHLLENPIWVLKVHCGIAYIGDEAGTVLAYNLTDKSIHVIDKRAMGIIDIFIINGTIAVASYDEDLVIHDLNTFKVVKKHLKIGTLWKIIQKGNFIFASCIYQGLKIFDLQFNLLKAVLTESICYAVCCTDRQLIWAPYYSCYIEWERFDFNGG